MLNVNMMLQKTFFQDDCSNNSFFCFVYYLRNALDEAGREVWLSNGTYWKLRKDPSFAKTENLDLW